MGGKALSLLINEDIKSLKKTLMNMTQELSWPHRAMADPYSLFNIPLDEVHDWYQYILEDRKQKNINQ